MPAPQCRELEETFLHAYVDGEFSVEESAEVKAHLTGCQSCTDAVRMHEGFKAAIARTQAHAPHALHDSVRASLLAESGGRWAQAFRDPRSVGLAAAAAGAAVWFLAGGLTHPIWRSAAHTMVDDGVALHARALPLDYTATDPGSAQKWLESRLDFGVRLPHLSRAAHLEGVRLSNVHSRQAAVVTYSLPQSDGHRVSLLIVDDPEPQLAGSAHKVADREVWLSQARGFNVASWRNDEIVYSLISDLSEQDVLALVQSAELH